jgi:hypothetical protein
MAKGTSLITKVGPSGLKDALNNLMTVLGNNLNPIYDQLVAYKDKCELLLTFLNINKQIIIKHFSEIPRNATIGSRKECL